MTAVQISVVDDRIHVRTRFQDKEICKSITGARWQPDTKSWHYPATPVTAGHISLAFNGRALNADDDFKELVAAASKQIAAFRAKDADALPEPWSKTKSWLHQRRAFHFAKDMPGGAMLAFEMGCGKTKTAIDLCNARGANRVLVVCPVSVQPVWPREFEQHSARQYMVKDLRGHTVRQRTEIAEDWLRLAKAHKLPAVLVINHEAAWRAPFDTFVKNAKFDVLVVDESHRAKDPKGKFSKFLWQTAKHIPYRLALTGTPMPHSPLDIFAQYRFLDEGVYGTSFWKFRDKYAVLEDGYQGQITYKKVVGFQNQKDLTEKFQSLAFRVTKDEALDLPPEIFETRYCTLAKETWKHYTQMRDDFYTEVKSGDVTAANALVRLVRLQQITSGYLRDDVGNLTCIGDEKANLLFDMASDELQSPFVVFARFIHDIEMIKGICRRHGLNCGEISGRRKDLDAGRFPVGLDALAVQIQAGGLGIDLTRANVAVYYSMGFNLAEYLQCQARLHRSGQSRAVTHIHLVAEDTIDEDVYLALKNRQDAVAAIIEKAKK